MTPEQNKTADKMKSVKATWDKAPSGPKKDAALIVKKLRSLHC